jgi:Protein of unknown function (DUF1559)
MKSIGMFVSTAILGLCLVIPFALPAPAPKEKLPAKPEAEIQAEPAKADLLTARKNEKTSDNNIKQMTLAILNYSDANKGEFPNDILDKNGKPILSWRVRILPYIEEQPLYTKLNLEEPWDSEGNLKLLEKMPKTFSSPRVVLKKAGYTVYQGFAGKGTAFEPGKLLQFPASFTDGTSNTICLVESSVAVPWTKPADLPYDEKKDLPDFGKAYDSRPLISLCDGSTKKLDLKKLSLPTLRAAITTSGGEVLGNDW